MNHFLTMFLAPDCSVPQAIMTSPPATKSPARRRRDSRGASLRFMAGVVANAAGFGLLLAGCWLFLQLLHLFLTL